MRRFIVVALLLPLLLLNSATAVAVSGERGIGHQTPAGDDAPPTYCASTGGTVSTGAAAGTVTSILYLWHPAAVTKRYKIRYGEIHAAIGSGTGTYLMRITSITAENVTPGGTVAANLPLVGTSPASAAVVRYGANAPTRTAADYFIVPSGIADPVHFALDSIPGFQPITLLGGVAAGMELRTHVVSPVTGGADVGAWVCWTED